jgi:aarF domain-containing kinase
MSGKRILDAVALLSAGRNVAAKHFEIRLSQVDLYSKTSSIGKAIRSRAERAAPSVYASAQSFTSAASHAARRSHDAPIPAQENVADPNSAASKDGKPMPDHHYERSKENTAVDSGPQEELHVEQEKAKTGPTADGTIPSRDSPIRTSPAGAETSNRRPITATNQDPLETVALQEGLKTTTSRQSLSSDEAKTLQRQSESQIPARPAEPPESSEFGVEQEQDVFYQPPGTTSPVLSALPRMRVPKVEWDVQGGDPHIPGGINPDVYYSGRDSAEVVEEEPTEEMLSQLFHSSKVSRMLGNKGKPSRGGARAFHNASRRLQKSTNEKEDIKRLAADMAKDVHDSDAVSKCLM